MGVVRATLGGVKLAVAVAASAWAACLISAALDVEARRRREARREFWARHPAPGMPKELLEDERELLQAERMAPPSV